MATILNTFNKRVCLVTGALSLLAILLAGCGNVQIDAPTAKKQTMVEQTAPQFGFEKISFEALQGWQNDNLKGAQEAFLSSCQYIEKRPLSWDADKAGPIENWLDACQAVRSYSAENIREFFETYFDPYQVGLKFPIKGKLTSYATPIVKGNLPPCGVGQTAFYKDPGQNKRYVSRQDILNGALDGSELFCVDGTATAFQAMIQGTVFLNVNDQTLIFRPVANNGEDYSSLSRYGMTIANLIKLDKVLPEAVELLTTLNPRVVYYAQDNGQVKGSINVPLVAGRSLAIDKNYTPYGVPVWLGTMQKLAMSHDAGNAIKGPARGDYYAGQGDEAMAFAKTVNRETTFHILLPKEHVAAATFQKVAKKTLDPILITAPENMHILQLGAFGSYENAVSRSDQVTSLVSQADIYPVNIAQKEGLYRVYMTGFASAEEARNQCAELKAVGLNCFYKVQ